LCLCVDRAGGVGGEFFGWFGLFQARTNTATTPIKQDFVGKKKVKIKKKMQKAEEK